MATVGALLGAGPTAGTVQITLFIPSVDRASAPIDQAFWRDEALRVFGRLFRGATAFPPGRGVWRDDAAFVELRRFLHRLGREARQGEVGVIVDGAYHGISDYDSAEEARTT